MAEALKLKIDCDNCNQTFLLIFKPEPECTSIHCPFCQEPIELSESEK